MLPWFLKPGVRGMGRTAMTAARSASSLAAAKGQVCCTPPPPPKFVIILAVMAACKSASSSAVDDVSPPPPLALSTRLAAMAAFISASSSAVDVPLTPSCSAADAGTALVPHPPSAPTANLRDLGNNGLSKVPDSSVLLTLAPSAPMPPAVPPITPAPLTSAPGVDASAPRSTMELEPLRRATTTRWLPHPLSSGDERFLFSV